MHPSQRDDEIIDTMALPSPPLRIGPHLIETPALLAPMSGITDHGFRKVAAGFGAGLVVSEMVAADQLAAGDAEARLRAEGAGLPLHVVQLAGCEPQPMAEGARLAEASGAAIIDINMGCPAKRVTTGWSGSALMRDLDHAQRLIEAVRNAVTVPVTLKMRLGWDESSLNAPELARRAEDCGLSLVTIHGRTRQQFYRGRANWHAVRAVRLATRLPVIVNGDIVTLATAREALAQSGADGVMIGRAALGQPWLVGEIGHGLSGRPWLHPTWAEKAHAMLAHYNHLLETMGLRQGVRHARKHVAAFANHAASEGIPIGSKELATILQTEESRHVIHFLESLGEAAEVSAQCVRAA